MTEKALSPPIYPQMVRVPEAGPLKRTVVIGWMFWLTDVGPLLVSVCCCGQNTIFVWMLKGKIYLLHFRNAAHGGIYVILKYFMMIAEYLCKFLYTLFLYSYVLLFPLFSLKSVDRADSGKYWCQIETKGKKKESQQVWLIVEGKGESCWLLSRTVILNIQ